MNNRSQLLIASVLVLSTQLSAQNAIPAPRQDHPIALVGGTIHTVSGETYANGTILFDKGTIVDVGPNVAIPSNAERIDIRTKHVYPGFVDAYNSIGLSEIGLGSPGTVDEAETGEINPSIRSEVAFHPESELIPVGRSGGVIVANVAPQGGLISGQSAAMMLEGWTWEEMTLRNRIGLIVNWPDMTYTPNPFRRQSKEEWAEQRNKQLTTLRDAFEHARAYMTAKSSEKSGGTPFHESDPSWDAMIPVLEGRIPIIVNAYDIAQIQAAVAFAEEQHVRLILAGAYDAWYVSDMLREKNIPVIITNIQSARRRWEPYDVVFSLPKKLLDAGIRFCITGDRSGSNIRNISHHAANASAYGLPRDEALKSVTLYPAMILGIADRVGSLQPGKDASLFISNGDALEITSSIEQVYIQGRKVDMKDKHVRLYEKYQEKYRHAAAQK